LGAGGGSFTVWRPRSASWSHTIEPLTRTIEPHRQRRPHGPEAGGVLPARVILKRPDAIADAVTNPSRSDRWTRIGCLQAKRPAQNAVKPAASGKQQTSRGESHTCLEVHPTPPSVDLCDRKRIARAVNVGQVAVFFVVVGRLATGV
jgi:hypothetical protein